jgi:hypothetical protein
MKELLGDVDEDLADFVLEQVRERKSPDDVVDGLEPVSISFSARSSSCCPFRNFFRAHPSAADFFRSSPKKLPSLSSRSGGCSRSRARRTWWAWRRGICWCESGCVGRMQGLRVSSLSRTRTSSLLLPEAGVKLWNRRQGAHDHSCSPVILVIVIVHLIQHST